MAGFLDQFRQKVIHSVRKEPDGHREAKDIDDKIALGVLLWVVARADARFLPEEKEKIKDVLKEYGKVPDEEMPYILESIEQADRERIDLYTFTRQIAQDLPYDVKKGIVENLFRVACVDGDLDHKEHEAIREISGLFRMEHKDFIDAKIKVKKEYGMDTAGL